MATITELKENLTRAAITCHQQTTKDLRPFNLAYKSLRHAIGYDEAIASMQDTFQHLEDNGIPKSEIFKRTSETKAGNTRLGYPEDWKLEATGEIITDPLGWMHQQKQQGKFGVIYLMYEPYYNMFYVGAKTFNKNFPIYTGRGKMEQITSEEYTKNGINRTILEITECKETKKLSFDHHSARENFWTKKFNAVASPDFHNTREGGGVESGEVAPENRTRHTAEATEALDNITEDFMLHGNPLDYFVSSDKKFENEINNKLM